MMPDWMTKASSELWEFFRQNFDKLLLAAIFLYLTVLLLHMSHDPHDAATVSWAREQANLIIGALLGLITGTALRRDKP